MVHKISNETIKKLWNSRQTMLEVLIDRGYIIKDTDFITFEKFKKWAGKDSLDDIKKGMTLRYTSPHSNKIIVTWSEEEKLGSKILEKLYTEMKNTSANQAIIVVDEGITPKAKGDIINMSNKREHVINVYTIEEAQYNIMKHKYVPKHILCSDEEKKRILDEYSIKQDGLPQIKLSDPAVRHIGASVGQLVKIFRDSDTQTGFLSISYRIVTDQSTNSASMQKSKPISMFEPPSASCWKM